MRYFYISGHSHLSGRIPEELGNLVFLKSLYLKSNNLTGEIPRTFGKLINLEDLQLDGNGLSGRIPEEVGNCTYLRVLQLDNNRLIGAIPQKIGLVQQIRTLSVVNNNLTGTIPNFTDTPILGLVALDLRQNYFTGAISESLGNGPLKYLLVSGNPFLKSPDGKSLPLFIKVNYNSTSVNDHFKNYSCPGYSIDSYAFNGTAPIVQMDPTYYNYTHCYCMNGFFGLPPNQCYSCIANGNCRAQNATNPDLFGSMSIPQGYYPVQKKGLNTVDSVVGLVRCIWNEKTKTTPCNPKGACYYRRQGLAGTGFNCVKKAIVTDFVLIVTAQREKIHHVTIDFMTSV